MNWGRRYLAVTLLAIIAITQFVLVYTTSLTRWRGGGFGMYSDFHERHGDVWAEVADFADADYALRLDRDAAGGIHTFAVADRLTHLGQQLDADDFAWSQIGLWGYAFDPRDLQFSRELRVEIHRERALP